MRGPWRARGRGRGRGHRAGAPWKQMRASFIGSVWLRCSLAVRDYETPKVPGTLTIRLLKDSLPVKVTYWVCPTSSLPPAASLVLAERSASPIAPDPRLSLSKPWIPAEFLGKQPFLAPRPTRLVLFSLMYAWKLEINLSSSRFRHLPSGEDLAGDSNVGRLPARIIQLQISFYRSWNMRPLFRRLGLVTVPAGIIQDSLGPHPR